MAEHVANFLLPMLDELVRNRSPHATLAISSIPLGVTEWLEQTRGVLVGPMGTFAATNAGDALASESFYEDRYVCVMRRGHPLESGRWTAKLYAAQNHVLVTPRGRSQRSDVDEQLNAKGLARRVVRVVPSFMLALSLVSRSDVITTIPESCTGQLSPKEFTTRNVPLPLRSLAMKIVVHPGHANDARITFIKELLRTALMAVDHNH
jgi:DNA-binding transcriptional LysR family regulator